MNLYDRFILHETCIYSLGMIDDDSSGATIDLSQKLKKSRMEVADSDRYDSLIDIGEVFCVRGC